MKHDEAPFHCEICGAPLTEPQILTDVNLKYSVAMGSYSCGGGSEELVPIAPRVVCHNCVYSMTRRLLGVLGLEIVKIFREAQPR